MIDEYYASIIVVLGAPEGGSPEFDTVQPSRKARFQWRRQDFSGTPRPFKGYQHFPGGVLEAAAPRMVKQFKILIRFEVLENESSFQKYYQFSRKSRFSKKN